MKSRPSPSTPRRRHQRSLWLAVAWLGALLWMQTLGLVHGVSHGHGMPHIVAGAPPGSTGFDGHDAGSIDCQLYDHLAHSDLANPPLAGAWGLQPMASQVVLWARTTPRLPSARKFSARDPPLQA